MGGRNGLSFDDRYPRVAAAISSVKGWLPPVTFITLHYAYFIVVCLVSSLIFWGSSSEEFKVSYVDSLFLVVSAMSEAGLNTVNLSLLNTWQQVLLWLLILLGSAIWVSIWTVVARKHTFEKRFDAIVAAERARKRSNASGLPRLLPGIETIKRTFSTLSTSAGLPGLGPRVPTVKRPNGDAAGGVVRPSSEEPATTQSSPPEDRQAARELYDAVASEVSGQQSAPQESPRERESVHIAFEDPVSPKTNGPGASTSFAAGPAQRRPVMRRAGTSALSSDGRDGGEGGGAGEAGRNDRFVPRTIREFLDNTRGGRNGQFHDLSSEERDQLGGCEYRALKLLAVVVPIYFVMWQFLGCVALGAWITNNQPEPALRNGIKPWWLGIFNGVSAMGNNGMSLLDANMVPFQESIFVLITMGLLILAGNTAYPIFLRLILWSGLRLLRAGTDESSFVDLKATLEFILKYPRRVYTNLFPSRQTWWLLFMVVLLNSVDWVAFELMNFGNPVVENIPKGARVLDGFFQALAVRSGGFYVVPIAGLFIGLQMLYIIMMYISVYPVVITMRHSNVYEERSLGIYDDDETPGAFDPEAQQGGDQLLARNKRHESAASQPPRKPGWEFGHTLRRALTPWHGVGASVPPADDSSMSRINFISQQIHGQLAHDIWWLVLAVLVITTIETSHFISDPVTHSVSNVIFEVVSAYGTVGLSVGVPYDNFSFSGSWYTSSKLVLCLVMLRGRHRGLPVALDRAVRLPGDELHREEEEDHRIRRSMSRRMSTDIS